MKFRIIHNPRIVYMGTPDFSVHPFKALFDNGFNVAAVVTQPDRPCGRGRKTTASPVKQMAGKYQVEVLQPENISDIRFYNAIQSIRPDLVIVVAFGQILPRELLATVNGNIINIHASLLPEYRGAAPIQWAILHDKSHTGLTLMRMEEGLDTGPLLFQDSIPIIKDETAGQLHDRLASLTGDFLIRSLNTLMQDGIDEILQDNSKASYAPKIGKELAEIDWSQSASAISSTIRGLDPSPGAYTNRGTEKMKLFASSVLDNSRVDVLPGRVAKKEGEFLVIETGKGLLGVREIQYPGKRRMSVTDFLRGYHLPEGAMLGA